MDLSFLSLPSVSDFASGADFRAENAASLPPEAPFLLFRLGESLFGVPALAVRLKLTLESF